MRRHYVYKAFERFWHWAQMILVFAMVITGFEIHGTYRWLGFETAVRWHNRAAYALIVLIAFAIFWHFTTGAWKSYIPTGAKVSKQIQYYTVGIFKNEPHPYKKTELSLKNPLQQYSYLALKLLVIPIQVTTGLLYFYYNRWPEWGIGWGLNWVAIVHTLAAFGIVAFVITHVYATTMGQTATSNLKAMITGWEEFPVEEEEAESDLALGQVGSD